MISGFATPEGTQRYRDRFPALSQAGHFRPMRHTPGADLWLSSIGMGTYLGAPDNATDAGYCDAARAALRAGINLLDTAINYRHQRSERNIGSAILSAIGAGEIQRDEVLVCTKAGFLTFDGDVPSDPLTYFRSEYLDRGLMQSGDIVGGMHCMSAGYLENQLERSRKNLGLETVDLMYIHNPESQLAEVSRTQFMTRVRAAFQFLEGAVRDRKLRFYGTATWSGYRLAKDHRDYLSLQEVVNVAREAGGEDHHFRFVQLPFNLALTEAFMLKNQTVAGEELSLIEAAVRLGVAVIGSATLYQGRLAQNLPPFVREQLGFESDAESAIQFSRSAPGMLSSLIGMSRGEHVTRNLRVAAKPPAAVDAWLGLFKRS
jgi:aryl-alcohol dehydrogenase-like predicted oxidoreductase